MDCLHHLMSQKILQYFSLHELFDKFRLVSKYWYDQSRKAYAIMYNKDRKNRVDAMLKLKKFPHNMIYCGGHRSYGCSDLLKCWSCNDFYCREIMIAGLTLPLCMYCCVITLKRCELCDCLKSRCRTCRCEKTVCSDCLESTHIVKLCRGITHQYPTGFCGSKGDVHCAECANNYKFCFACQKEDFCTSRCVSHGDVIYFCDKHANVGCTLCEMACQECDSITCHDCEKRTCFKESDSCMMVTFRYNHYCLDCFSNIQETIRKKKQKTTDNNDVDENID
jgi:hypothetical protein